VKSRQEQGILSREFLYLPPTVTLRAVFARPMYSSVREGFLSMAHLNLLRRDQEEETIKLWLQPFVLFVRQTITLSERGHLFDGRR
jgi:hypothetical protein